MTRIISGRPARCLPNEFTALERGLMFVRLTTQSHMTRARRSMPLLKAAGEAGFEAQWAGQGAPLARALPASELLAALASEMQV